MRRKIIRGLLTLAVLTFTAYLLTWPHWHPVAAPAAPAAIRPSGSSAPTTADDAGTDRSGRDEDAIRRRNEAEDREQEIRDRIGLPP
jgi:hypothetical protein